MGHHGRLEGLRVGVLTCSDSRTPDDDTSGSILRNGVEGAGHTVCDYRIVPDEPDRIVGAVREMIAGGAQAIISTGGTGVTARDWTYEALSSLLTKPLPGFGELFRMLSWEQVSSAAFLSRATAGLVDETVVFVLPGSTKAVSLAWEQLIEPQIGHLCWLAVRDRGR